MPRPVPSDWTPKSFELFEIGHLFSPEADAEILAFLGCGSASAAQKERVLDRVHFTAAVLRTDLYYARKPTTGQMAAAIDPLKASADELASILDKLDHESRGLLEHTADTDEISNSRHSNETPRIPNSYVIDGETRWAVNSLGRERISRVLRSIQDLSRWAEAAMQAEVVADPPRKKRKDAIRDAIERLQVLWREVRATQPDKPAPPPTLMPFLPLVRAVLNPILAEDGQPESLRKATQDVLHGVSDKGSTGTVQDPYPSGGSA